MAEARPVTDAWVVRVIMEWIVYFLARRHRDVGDRLRDLGSLPIGQCRPRANDHWYLRVVTGSEDWAL